MAPPVPKVAHKAKNTGELLQVTLGKLSDILAALVSARDTELGESSGVWSQESGDSVLGRKQAAPGKRKQQSLDCVRA